MIELPKDAHGREIPLDTEVLYDEEGKRREVDWYTYYPDKDRWDVVFEGSCVRFSPRNLSLTTPDSWEKLEGDLDRCIAENNACMYYSTDGTCQNCAILGTSSACTPKILENILDRISKLRGEGDA